MRSVGPGQPLVTLKGGAPGVHISNMRLLGRLVVEGGELQLTDCSIEADHTSLRMQRRLDVALASDRPLAIGGSLVESTARWPVASVILTRVDVRDHPFGAISVHAAMLTLVDSTIEGCRAQSGAAMRIGDGAVVRVQRSRLIDNTADRSGGAIQVACLSASQTHSHTWHA